MDDLINMVAGNESPTDIHSKIKDLLTKKALTMLMLLPLRLLRPCLVDQILIWMNLLLKQTKYLPKQKISEVDADQQPTDEVETDSSEEEEIESPTAEVETPDDEEEN